MHKSHHWVTILNGVLFPFISLFFQLSFFTFHTFNSFVFQSRTNAKLNYCLQTRNRKVCSCCGGRHIVNLRNTLLFTVGRVLSLSILIYIYLKLVFIFRSLLLLICLLSDKGYWKMEISYSHMLDSDGFPSRKVNGKGVIFNSKKKILKNYGCAKIQ